MKIFKGLAAALPAAAMMLCLSLPARADMATDLATLNKKLLAPMALADFRTVGGDGSVSISSTQIQMMDTHTAKVTMQMQLPDNAALRSVPHAYIVHLNNKAAHGMQATYLITKPDAPKFHLTVGLDSQKNIVLLQGPGRLE